MQKDAALSFSIQSDRANRFTHSMSLIALNSFRLRLRVKIRAILFLQDDYNGPYTFTTPSLYWRSSTESVEQIEHRA